MSAYLKAAEQVDRLADHYRTLADTAATLRELGSMEQRAIELKGTIEASAAELVDVTAKLTKDKGALNEAEERAREIVDAATSSAKEIERAAMRDQERQVAEGKRQAEAIIASAQAEAARSRAGKDQVLGQLTSEIERLSGEVKAAEKRRAELANEVGALEQQREKARAALQAVLNAV